MNIHWDSLLAVFLASLGSAVARAMLGLTTRTAVADGPATSPTPRRSRLAGTAAAGACLAVAAAIVLSGLWVVVAK